MGMDGVSKSQVSRLCEDIDERVQAFLNRPLEGQWPYLWIDATYVKVRRNNRVVSVAAIVAVAVNTDCTKAPSSARRLGAPPSLTLFTTSLRRSILPEDHTAGRKRDDGVHQSGWKIAMPRIGAANSFAWFT